MGASSHVEGQDILQQVKEAAAKRILFLPHAVHQMNSPERMISTEEVRVVIFQGAIITTYLPNPEQWEADWRTRKQR
jgi:hypothetical protein